MMFVYILVCADGSLYTGWTDDLQQRVRLHKAGRAAKYTRSRLPVRLRAWIKTKDAATARSIEARFKRLRREAKVAALKAGRVFGLRLHKVR